MQILLCLPLVQPVGQLRATPFRLTPDRPPAIPAAYASDFDVDPYHEMFFVPKETLKLIVFTTDCGIHWQRDLGLYVVPGMWFCPVSPFDLDGDGSSSVRACPDNFG